MHTEQHAVGGTVSSTTPEATEPRATTTSHSSRAQAQTSWHIPDWVHPNVDQDGPGRGWRIRYQRRVVVSDFLAALVACFVAAMALYSGIPNLRVALLTTVVPFAWVIICGRSGAYRVNNLGIGLDEYRSIGHALLILLALLSVTLVALGWRMSRLLFFVAVPLIFLLTVIARRVLRGRLARARTHGHALQPTIVVGRGLAVHDMIASIQNDPMSTGMKVVGACASDLPDPQRVANVAVYGGPETALLAVRDTGAEAVVVASDASFSGKALRRLGWALAEIGVDLFVHPGINEVASPRLTLRPAAGMSLLHVEGPTIGGFDAVAKRAIDIFCSSLIALVTMPVWLFIAFSIWLHDRGPVFFVQQRVGENGRTFPMVKFRTMVVDAEQRLLAGELSAHPQVNEMLFKHKHDPRITKPGRILRRLSLDELPQLINVLRGEMSLVGPRPPLPREVDAYEPDAMRRLKVRPGLTGMWQISGRSDLNWEESLRLDLWYVDNWSPVLDVMILMRTVRAVLKADGAY
ncbi:MAG: sugar transferase [Actinobacteria bacterium]|uniref:Sugar transferase n=1 Tax=Nostocoides veronense TaxID=330836 RepID=A0ABN2LQG3_9MICO|nr:sugar transferase [Actinomycetota bacterium]